jgi:hypothetical protein
LNPADELDVGLEKGQMLLYLSIYREGFEALPICEQMLQESGLN